MLALSSGLIPILKGNPFLTGVWLKIPVAGNSLFEIGTSVLFDLECSWLWQAVTTHLFIFVFEEEI